MKRTSTRVAVAVIVIAAAGAVRAAPDTAEAPLPGIESLAWMAGHWGASRTGTDTEEYWLAPKGGLMLGLHREARGSEAFFEYLRIEQSEAGVVYFASPGGRGATPFRMTVSEERRVVFENPEHDFPQSLTYELDADGALRVRAEAAVEGGKRRVLAWRWERLDGASPAAGGASP